MQDVLTLVAGLNRPRLLVRTARAGLSEYNRVRHLSRLLKTEQSLGPSAALLRLLEIEREVNAKRLESAADYSVARHVELLIAIISEADALRVARGPRLVPAVT